MHQIVGVPPLFIVLAYKESVAERVLAIDEKINLCYIKTVRLKLMVLNFGGDTWQSV